MSEESDQIKFLNGCISQIIDTCTRLGVSMSRDGYGVNVRADLAEVECAGLKKSLTSRYELAAREIQDAIIDRDMFKARVAVLGPERDAYAKELNELVAKFNKAPSRNEIEIRADERAKCAKWLDNHGITDLTPGWEPEGKEELISVAMLRALGDPE